MKTIQQMIAADPSVAPAFAQQFRPVIVRELCLICAGLSPSELVDAAKINGVCRSCAGRGYIVTERARV
jgi:hypothetical protein